MRIGLQAFLWGQAGSYRQSGVSNYIRHLVLGLPAADPPGELCVYLPSRAALADLDSQSTLKPRVSPLKLDRPTLRILWEHSGFPLALWRDGVDLLHATMNVAPWWTPCPLVVTIHDLAYMRYPEVHPRGRRLYLNLLTRLTVRRARAVIAVSEFTGREVQRLLGVPGERIQVIYEGVDPDFCPRPPEEVAAFRERRGLPPRYLLYLGNLEPRKNLRRLVQAYARVATDAPLVLAGARGWGYEALFAEVEALGLSERVLFPGFVPREELPLWYNGAVALVYPSRYEGFGLPPLEAMACGTPVLTSTASSLPEVVGEAGLQVSAEDVPALAAAMQRLLDRADLRAELRQRGLERARRFSWSNMARETAALYVRLLELG
ncbi:MAG: glycosyltransferase family 4 protein [Chloroflexia bacterium]|nr:glycosyltransferase family 4 protein [Chloroflexia bacterium]